MKNKIKVLILLALIALPLFGFYLGTLQTKTEIQTIDRTDERYLELKEMIESYGLDFEGILAKLDDLKKLEDLENLDIILAKLESLDKLDEILLKLDELEALNEEIIIQLGQILSYVENQEEFNIQLVELISNLNMTHIDTVVYEIHNETLIEVDTINIENATCVYNIDELNIENVTFDIDLYYKCHEHTHHCCWFAKCYRK